MQEITGSTATRCPTSTRRTEEPTSITRARTSCPSTAGKEPKGSIAGLDDLARLSELVISLKRANPDKEDASVLLEPGIEYDHLIQVMDVVRSARIVSTTGDEPQQMALFSDISIGDAP